MAWRSPSCTRLHSASRPVGVAWKAGGAARGRPRAVMLGQILALWRFDMFPKNAGSHRDPRDAERCPVPDGRRRPTASEDTTAQARRLRAGRFPILENRSDSMHGREGRAKRAPDLGTAIL